MTLPIDRRTIFGTAAGLTIAAAGGPGRAAAPELRFRLDEAALRLDPVTQTARSFAPAAATGFDFLPAKHLDNQPEPGRYALGDIDLRLRTGGSAWRDYSSAFHRAGVAAVAAEDALAAADLSPLFPRDMPLKIERRWEQRDGDLVLRFVLTNRSGAPVEVGGLGLAMPFDNILTGRSLDQAHDQTSFTEPYIGQDGGYVIVARLSGAGPVLLVLPEPGTPLEAWKIIPSSHPAKTAELGKDRTERRVTFEGFYHWMAATRGWVENEWRGAEQWNPPTGFTLAPGETRSFGVRLVLAPSIRGIEDRLAAAGRPVIVGLPGYVVTPDADSALFVKSRSPVRAVEVSPPGALAIGQAEAVGPWQRRSITAGPAHWGRARVTLTYADGTRQTVQYFVMKPAAQAVADLGRHSFTEQWFDSPGDRFGRSPAVMSYDRAEHKIVTSDRRVYVAGLSDEAGAGPWLAAIMKQLDNPDAAEIAKFERFHVHVVEGALQREGGETPLGVVKSVFYYDPALAADYDPDVDWSRWPSWKTDEAFKVSRSYNYPHVAAAQWVLYRLARNHVGLVKAHDWRWYLDRAARTTLAMCRYAPHDIQFGNMEGSVFLAILLDLKREGMTALAAEFEAAMKKRADHWSSLRFPFGSEMPWDSTGQEEVHSWMHYFGDRPKAAVTREVILAYDHTVPHWGYNGSARRYWDFRIAAKLQREERQLHHYGSSMNALPLFIEYRLNPADFHLLRVAYGGLQGSITNIDRDGFAAAAFHAWPDSLKFDDLTGDYGPSFFAHAFGTASYLVRHDEFGWLAFGGRLSEDGGTVRLAPADSGRSRCFVAPAGLWITLDAGKLDEVRYDPKSGAVTLTLAPATPHTPTARLRLEATVANGLRQTPRGRYAVERGAWAISLGDKPMVVPMRVG